MIWNLKQIANFKPLRPGLAELKLISAIAAFLIYLSTNAPVNMHFKQVGVPDGLSQTSITCILQDSRGFIWISTYDGVNRHDGYEFKIYRHEPNNPYSLASSRVISMKEDDDGSIWMSGSVFLHHGYHFV